MARTLAVIAASVLAASACQAQPGDATTEPTVASVTSVETTSSADGFEPPAVAPPVEAPFYEGGLQHLQYVVDCVAEAGFSVALLADQRAIVYHGDDPIYTEVNEACYQAPIAQGWVRPGPFTGEEGLRLRFRLWLITHECLSDHGYPTLEVPSEDTYVSEGGRNWHPYGALPTPGLLVITSDRPLSDAERTQLDIQADCPAHLSDLLWEYERANEGRRP